MQPLEKPPGNEQPAEVSEPGLANPEDDNDMCPDWTQLTSTIGFFQSAL